jgi:pimeloyl-ACP methyl ester carboxylesterase
MKPGQWRCPRGMSTSHTLTSADGTTIGYSVTGSGPALVSVDGAFCSREFGSGGKIAAELARDFTVYTYDRRGRGASGDTRPWSVEREVEDLAAVIEAAGGRASLLGCSSGGALAMEAAARLDSVEQVAVYEVPFVLDPAGNVLPDGFIEQIEAHVAHGRPGDAARQFMLHVGTPRPAVAVMRRLPLWKKLEAVAHTLPYDLKTLGDTQHGAPLSAERFAGLTVPVLVMDGGKSPEWMRFSARAIAETLPNAVHRSLPGQTHMVKPKALAPVVAEFLKAATARPAHLVAA